MSFNPPARTMRPAPDGVAEDDFDQLLAVGRQRGYLTQDDLILVLQSVELSHDVIENMVGSRAHPEGIEYVEDPLPPDVPVELAAAVAEAVAEAVVEALPDAHEDVDEGGDDDWGPESQLNTVSPAQEAGSPSESAKKRTRRRRRKLDEREPRDAVIERQRKPPGRGRVATYTSDHGGGTAADPVHAYLKEIGKVPLLTADLEVELARRMEAGNAAAEELARRIEAGNAAAEELARSKGASAAAPEAMECAEAAPRIEIRPGDRTKLRREVGGATRPRRH